MLSKSRGGDETEGGLFLPSADSLGLSEQGYSTARKAHMTEDREAEAYQRRAKRQPQK
jgi:hypothetical protein